MLCSLTLSPSVSAQSEAAWEVHTISRRTAPLLITLGRRWWWVGGLPWPPPFTSSVHPDLRLNQRATPFAHSGIPLITSERRRRKMVRGKDGRTFCTSLLLVNQQESAVHVPDVEIWSAALLCSLMTCSVVTTLNLSLVYGLPAALRREDQCSSALIVAL